MKVMVIAVVYGACGTVSKDLKIGNLSKNQDHTDHTTGKID